MSKYSIDATILFELVEGYARDHENAVDCGSEYIFQSDTAQEDALELVGDIFDKAFKVVEEE